MIQQMQPHVMVFLQHVNLIYLEKGVPVVRVEMLKGIHVQLILMKLRVQQPLVVSL